MHVEHQHANGRHAKPSTNDTAQEPELRELPPEVAVMLMVIGILGIILPGPTGTPLFVAGASAFAPGLCRPMERWFRKRFPMIYREGRGQLDRFLDDLDRRYPTNSLAAR